MDIRILDSGFVTGDFLKPVAYAGEINSRKLNIIHPMFKDCVYQVLVKRYDGLYRLGVDDGMAEIPPSLTKTATTLECQFVAVAMPDTVNNVEVDDFLPVEANAEALMICEDKKCRFCVINSRRLKKNRREAKVMSVQEFKTEEPIGIAKRYAEDMGIEFDNDMKELFNETLAALKEEERL